jgi:hypothetical protein
MALPRSRFVREFSRDLQAAISELDQPVS